MHDLTNALERVHSEHSLKLQHIESGAVQQFAGLDNKTRSVADDVKTALHTVRVAEQGEREKLETRLLAQMERVLSQRDIKQVNNYTVCCLQTCNFRITWCFSLTENCIY